MRLGRQLPVRGSRHQCRRSTLFRPSHHFHDQIAFPGATLAAWSPDPEWTCAPAGRRRFRLQLMRRSIWRPAISARSRCGSSRRRRHPSTPMCAIVAGSTGAGSRTTTIQATNAIAPRSRAFRPASPAPLPCSMSRRSRHRPVFRVVPGGGWLCYYGVRVTNFGGAPFVGPIEFRDATLGPAATLEGVFPAPWTCAPGVGVGTPQTCTHPGVAGGLLPGASVFMQVDFGLPAAVPAPNALLNCAIVASDHDGDGFAEDHTSCALALVCEAGSADCPRDLATYKEVVFGRPVPAGLPVRVRLLRPEYQRPAVSRTGQHHRHTRPGCRSAVPGLGAARQRVFPRRRRFHLQLSGRHTARRWPSLHGAIHHPAGLPRNLA